MRLEELKKHYKTWASMARKLELGSSTYLGWRRQGFIPYDTQCVIEVKSNRLFLADRADEVPLKK